MAHGSYIGLLLLISSILDFTAGAEDIGDSLNWRQMAFFPTHFLIGLYYDASIDLVNIPGYQSDWVVIAVKGHRCIIEANQIKKNVSTIRTPVGNPDVKQFPAYVGYWQDAVGNRNITITGTLRLSTGVLISRSQRLFYWHLLLNGTRVFTKRLQTVCKRQWSTNVGCISNSLM